jgi:hypothetical protein
METSRKITRELSRYEDLLDMLVYAPDGYGVRDCSPSDEGQIIHEHFGDTVNETQVSSSSDRILRKSFAIRTSAGGEEND